MSKIGHNRLSELKATIELRDRAVTEALAQAVRAAMDAGDALIEAKGIVGHGKFMHWLATNVAVAGRTARLYMSLAENRPKIDAKLATVANFTLRQAAAFVSGERRMARWRREFDELWRRGKPADRAAVIKQIFLPGMASTAQRYGLGTDVVQAFREASKSDKVGERISDYVPEWALQRFDAYSLTHAEQKAQ